MIKLQSGERLLIDYTKPLNNQVYTCMPGGTWELRRIPNPYGHDDPWLVIKGHPVGMAEKAWRQYIKGNGFGYEAHLEVLIEENGELLPPLLLSDAMSRFQLASTQA